MASGMTKGMTWDCPEAGHDLMCIRSVAQNTVA
jgi:hypothetical protein